MIRKCCVLKITEEELQSLTQPERKRLGEIVRGLMTRDRFLTRVMAVEKAYPLVLTESVEG